MTMHEVGDASLAKVAFAIGRQLATDRNIVAVGAGAKLRAGVPTNGASVVFFVQRKLARDVLGELGTWPIPDQISGFSTDVVEVGALSSAKADRGAPVGSRGTRVDDPLVGGAATMALGSSIAGPGGFGTIGGQCFDNLTRGPLLLSNAHVWGTTAGVEVVQPIMASAIAGVNVAAARLDAQSLVLSRVPSGLAAPLAFANAVAQTFLIAGSASDPLPTGQVATPVTASTRTDAEQVIVDAPAVGLAPAGVRLSPTVGWSYQRLADTTVAQKSQTAVLPNAQVLTARRVFTNAASYSSGQTVNLYAEVVVPATGAPNLASAHHVLALLYPIATGDKFIPRVMRPVARQAVTTVTTSFAGFPAPAAAGSAALPALSGSFAVDAAAAGTFVVPPGGSGLPAGTFVLKLPAGSIRVFVPIGTQVILDLDLTGIPGPLTTVPINSARDQLPATVSTAPGTAGRTLVTISASEIVEVVIGGATNALLFGATSKRASPETTSPLCYAATIGAADLTPKGKWGVSLFVQTSDLGLTESANLVESSGGGVSLVNDTTFDAT